MIQALAIGLAVALAVALPAVAAEKKKKEDKRSVNFAIQHGTSDLQNKKTKGMKANPKGSKATLTKGWPSKIGN
jgi:hypothetical protein